MAKYGKSASRNVASTMRRKKKGTLKSGSGRKVTSQKQAIAIGLSEAREKGAKVPPRKSSKSSRKSSRKSSPARKTSAAGKTSKARKTSNPRKTSKRRAAKKE